MKNCIRDAADRAVLSRRLLLISGAFTLAGCVTDPKAPRGPVASLGGISSTHANIYAAVSDGTTEVPAIDLSEIDPRFLRQEVAFDGRQQPGTIVVKPQERFLYLVQENGRAMRYGVGVGKEGLAFQGEATIQRKAQWPGWVPTPSMIAREPERYGPYAGGLPGGLGNPLGARALYLYRGGKDTYYRLHGTNEPTSIGHSVSSGCIRLFNQDIIDLYNRTPVGSRVVVV